MTMVILGIPAPHAVLRTLTRVPLSPQPQWQRIFHLRCPHLRLCRPRSQLRCFTHQSPKPNASIANEALKRQAKSAAQSDTNYEIPERLIIYHAGTGRIAFLAMLKLTSLFLGAFFALLVVPSYVKAEKPLPDTAAVAVCGLVPVLFVAYSTAPFVTHMHMHLPAAARTSPAALRRFVGVMPPGTRLTLTTMSFIAKPRYSAVRTGDLRAAVPRKRMGLVNYQRDTTAENAARKWYMYRAVGGFYVHETRGGVAGKGRESERVRYQARRNTVVDTWIWEAVREKIATRD